MQKQYEVFTDTIYIAVTLQYVYLNGDIKREKGPGHAMYMETVMNLCRNTNTRNDHHYYVF